MFERFEHVRIAQIPRFSPAVVHDAIIALRRGDEPRILRCVQEAFFVWRGVLELPAKEVLALLNDGLFAFPVAFGENGTPVCRGLLLPRSETPVPLPRDLRG